MKQNSKITLRVLAIASFLNDLGSDMILPVWPVFLTSVLKANMAVVGLVDGIGEAVVSLSQVVSGYYSDKWQKRKLFVWLGYSCAAISRLGYSISNSWAAIIPFKLIDRSGKMRGSPRDAIVADITTDGGRGRAFGFLETFDNAGAVLGILLSVVLIHFINFKLLFLLAAVPSVIAVMLVVVFLDEVSHDQKRIFKGIQIKNLDQNIKRFFVGSAVFSLGSFTYSFLLLYAQRVGFRVAMLPLLYLIFTLLATLYSLKFGKLADRRGRKYVLYLSYGLWIAALLAFLLSNQLSIVIGFVLYGLHLAAYKTVQKVYVSDLAPSTERASILGGYQMVTGLCALPASVIAGVLWDKIDATTPLYFSLILTLVASFSLRFVKETK